MKAAFTVLAVAGLWGASALAQSQNTSPQEARRPDDGVGGGYSTGMPLCGGGAIENGLRVQPSPSRDECLARLRGLTLTPGNSANEDVRLGAQGVPQVQVPPASPQPGPQGGR